MLAVGTLLGLFFSLQVYLISVHLKGKPIAWSRALAITLSDWYVWVALFPLIRWLARRFPPDLRNWKRSLAIHLPLSLCCAPLQLLVHTFLLRLIAWDFADPFRPFLELLPVKFHWNVLIYWLILAAASGYDYYRQSKDRERRAGELEAELAKAQLQSLRWQLHPHFLFNSLNAVSQLVHEDPDAAEKMITQLSKLLRSTLVDEGPPETSLRRELQFIRSYLEIEQIRLGSRLAVSVDVAEEVLDARVPTFILQPLVENALRHGVEKRMGTGHLHVHAGRREGMLEMQVLDDGPGLDRGDASLVKEGIGLHNTRERLRRLYNSNCHFELSARAQGGLAVTVRIPFCAAAGGDSTGGT